MVCDEPKHRLAFYVYNILGVVYLITMLIMIPYIRGVDEEIKNYCVYAQKYCSGCSCMGYSANLTDIKVYTKAFCNDNSCIDLEVTCIGGNVVKIKPIGNLILRSEDWISIHYKEEGLC